MRLEDLYKNFGESSPEEQAQYIADYRLRRAEDMSKAPTKTKRKTASPTDKKSKIDFSEEEKALMRTLGLKQRDVLALREAVAPEADDIDEDQSDLFSEDYDESED